MAINEKITISKTGFVSVQLSNHSTPQFEPDRNGNFIKYGENNDYPNYLIDLFNRNAEHSAIISGKVNYISGNGLKYKPVEDLKVEAKLQAWINNANRFESWNDILNPITLDFELFNGVWLELLADPKGRIQEYYHIPFSKLRLSEDKKSVWYCENWSKKNRSEFEPIQYPLYDPEKPYEKSFYFYKLSRPASDNYSDAYPLPDYMGCISDIETDIEVSMNQYYNLKNGLTANAIINIYGNNPTDDEKREIARNLIYTHGSSRRAGTFYLNFTADTNTKGADVTPLELPEAYKRFESLGPRLQQKIFTGHKVTSPIIFGIKTEGQLGGRTELLEAFETFTKSYVEIRRRHIESFIKYFASLRGLPAENLYIEGVSPIGEELPLDGLHVSEVMTIDEKREYLNEKYGTNLAPDPEKDSRLNLAQKIGVGGISSFLDVLKDDGFTPKEKSDILQAMYGLKPKRANLLSGYDPLAPITDKVDTTSLAQQIGVGGVQGLTAILQDPTITPQSKSNMAQIIFGVKKEQADALAGLAPLPTPQVQPQPTQMSKQKDPVLEMLLSSCIDDEDDEVLEETYITFDKVAEFEKSVQLKFAEVVTNDVATIRKKILDLIAGNPEIKVEDLAKQLGVDKDYINSQIGNLIDKGILTENQTGFIPTGKGFDKVEDIAPTKTEIYTVYKYVKRDDVSGEDILPTTREFCAELVRKSKAGKSWTRDAIEKIEPPDSSVGSVWVYRGGFYNDGGETTPYCRHLWKGITKIKRTKK